MIGEKNGETDSLPGRTGLLAWADRPGTTLDRLLANQEQYLGGYLSCQYGVSSETTAAHICQHL